MRKVNDALARYRSGERADEQEAQLALHGCALRLSNKLEEYTKSWKAETIDEKNLLDITYKSELEALVRNGLGDLARLLDQCIVLRGDVTDKYSNNEKSFRCRMLRAAISTLIHSKIQSYQRPFAFPYASFVLKSSGSLELTNVIAELLPGGLSYAQLRQALDRMCDNDMESKAEPLRFV